MLAQVILLVSAVRRNVRFAIIHEHDVLRARSLWVRCNTVYTVVHGFVSKLVPCVTLETCFTNLIHMNGMPLYEYAYLY